LLSRTTVIAGLSGANLLSSYLLCCSAIVGHVRSLCVRGYSLILLTRWRRGLEVPSVRVGWTDSMIVSIRYAAIGTMLRVHWPRGLVPTMLHGNWMLRLDVGVDTDTGGTRTGRVLGGRRLWRRWLTITGDAVLGECHGRSTGAAMRRVTWLGYSPRVRKRTDIRGWKRG
jgi:hypothetical protein